MCVWNKDRIEAGLLEGGACPGLWGWEAPEARREGRQGAEPRTQPLPGRSGAEPCSAFRALCKLGSAVDKREGALSSSCRIQASSPLRWLRGCSRLSTHMLSAVTSGTGNGDVRPAAGSRARCPQGGGSAQPGRGSPPEVPVKRG